MISRSRTWTLLAGGILALAICRSAPGQNLVRGNAHDAVLTPVRLTPQQASDFLERRPVFAAAPDDPETQRVVAKLDRHVTAFLNGYPWRAFHHTLGISGYESSFGHPDEMFLSLSLALPYLPRATARHTRAFLRSRLEDAPPYAIDGFDRMIGGPRERYDVPDALRSKGRATAHHALGVYAFWLYCHVAGDEDAAKTHWPAVRERMRPLLASGYRFDPEGRDYSHDEAENLNGDLAGLLGLWRLAEMNDDPKTATAARDRATQLLALRINLERVNPRFVEPTHSASNSLHVFKLARYCSMVPEVAHAVRRHSGGLAASRLREYREARNAWWLAFGDRFIGGENYTNPMHFARALFTGAACIEELPTDDLSGFLDVPWCHGDFYFMEKCALTLWAISGRTWSQP